MPVFTEESVKKAITNQNLTWLKNGELTRIEYIDSTEPNGDRFYYMFILTGVPVSANVYPLNEFLKGFITSLEEDVNDVLPIDKVISQIPLSPKDVQRYYSDLTGQTNHEFFGEFYKLDEEKDEKILFEKLEMLYYDLHLEYLLNDEMKELHQDYMAKIKYEFTQEEIHEMEIVRSIAKLGDDLGLFTYPTATTDGKNIYFGRYHVSSGIHTVYLPSYISATDMPTIIKKRAFAGCDTIKEVIIHDTIGKKEENGDIVDDSSFGEGSFFACSNLEKVSFYESYAYIPRNAFENCEALKEVLVSSALREIGEFAFYGCIALKNPDIFKDTNLQKIGYCAFLGCGFTTINLPETLMVIEEKAFCSSMLESIIIPESVYLIDQSAFQSCQNLKSVKYDGEIKEISINCFSNCYELKHVDLPNGLKKINELAFNSCTRLPELFIPDGVEEIGADVFKNCINLRNIRFPASVTSLGLCDFDKNLKIKCKENSYIHKRAIKEKWNFELY